MNCDSTNHENENMFDDCLEGALKKYQAFYNLNITGLLDANTIQDMLQPRCGMPDIHNPTNNTDSFHKHFAFLSGRPKWKQRRLRYAFNKFTKPEMIPPMEHAVKQWGSKTQFKFVRANDFSDKGSDIRITFMGGYHGDNRPFPESEPAHAFDPPDGRIHFDRDQRWSANGAQGAYDIQTVTLHVLGHALGLGHSRIQEAVMFPKIGPGVRKGLHKDDIQGIKALYK